MSLIASSLRDLQWEGIILAGAPYAACTLTLPDNLPPGHQINTSLGNPTCSKARLPVSKLIFLDCLLSFLATFMVPVMKVP